MDTPARPGGTLPLPSGTTCSRLGIGCWPIGGPAHNLGMPMGWSTADDHQALAGLERAFALGANLFDTADVYGHGHSEQLLGTFLRGIPRHEFAVTSKVGYFTEPGTGHAMEPAHLRRRLEGTLGRLGVDHLDVYSLHNADFGPGDALLEKAVATLRGFQQEGLIRSVGMRGPHRFAPERLTTEPGQREDKHARFRRHFAEIRPDVLAVRDNLLTPASATDGIREFSAAHSVTVIVNKALGQGLLTGKHTAAAPPAFADGDHRQRKAWFTEPALAVLGPYLDEIRHHLGDGPAPLAHAALAYCLRRWPGAAVLAGFTTASQVEQNLTCDPARLTTDDLLFLAEVGQQAQQALDQLGEVFTDEANG
ncbi:aryl-alcohol dehydrogenase-like predicted oxidoreductase [Kitasatospora gansuensis]|uniref:Aryl-alcohol dehydrogenase-like predicted oxidoreductase n=1 Tax=Kitasatospora gansuensis TaxID=258050 RepID=A0A7W7SFF9_9ACTN|nr:aldo/keto reductase [Kitasatospora gansuensis]MBB4949491.1 aryl-alcohol dehydrogenase-like predicted oxidoreductase [Kitasatospora gansuensis]